MAEQKNAYLNGVSDNSIKDVKNQPAMKRLVIDDPRPDHNGPASVFVHNEQIWKDNENQKYSHVNLGNSDKEYRVSAPAGQDENGNRKYDNFMAKAGDIAASFQKSRDDYRKEKFAEQMKDPAQWQPTQKVTYEIWAKQAPEGQALYNHLEDADYKTKPGKDIVLSGTVGEQWPVSPDKVAKTYVTPGQDSFQGFDTSGANNGWTKLQSKAEPEPTVFAMQIPSSIKNFPVQTSWGETLYANSTKSEGHGKGDFLVCEMKEGEDGKKVPNMDDMRVVNHDIFVSTYDVSMFKGEKQVEAKDPPAPEGFVTRESMVEKQASAKNRRLPDVSSDNTEPSDYSASMG